MLPVQWQRRVGSRATSRHRRRRKSLALFTGFEPRRGRIADRACRYPPCPPLDFSLSRRPPHPSALLHWLSGCDLRCANVRSPPHKQCPTACFAGDLLPCRRSISFSHSPAHILANLDTSPPSDSVSPLLSTSRSSRSSTTISNTRSSESQARTANTQSLNGCL